jgi:hypothetical protein
MKSYRSQHNPSSVQTVTVVMHLPVRKIAMLVPVLVVLLVFTTLAAAGFFDLRGVFAQEEEPAAPRAVEAFTSAGTLNFQGELRDQSSGSPLADGEYRMRFAIYDAESGGSQHWPVPSPDYEEHTAVSVVDGLFNALLGSHITIPGTVFNDGGDRYLQTWVCPTAGTGCTDFEDLGRLPISSVAYAKSFVPGTTVSGSGTVLSLSSSATDGGVLNVNASSSTGNAAGVYAQSLAPNGAGLSGYNGGSGVGVYGGSLGGTAVYGTAPTLGVVGDATAGSGVAYGVKGQNASYNGAGVYGTSNYASGTGVKGESSAGPGVYGVSTSGIGTGGQSNSGAGLWGFSDSGDGVTGTSTSGAGLRGTSTISGSVGIATRNTGTNYGVYGQNASADGAGVHGASTHPDGYGVYSDGNAHVEGDLAWKPRTSYVSVAPAAFQPSDNGIDYHNEGYAVWHKGFTGQWDMESYFAPVALPHQSQLQSLSATVCAHAPLVYDGTLELRLLRSDTTSLQGVGPTELSTIIAGLIDGDSCARYTITVFADDSVDNSRYVYYLGLWMEGNVTDEPRVSLQGVIIEYKVSHPY